MINTFFTGDKDPGKNNFWPLALDGLGARITNSFPGYPGSIPGQGIKISFHATTHCYLTEITSMTRVIGQVTNISGASVFLFCKMGMITL